MRARFLFYRLLIVMAMGCVSAPQQRPVTQEQRIEMDDRIGDSLARQFEPSMKLRSDRDVTTYLERVGNQLVRYSAELELGSLPTEASLQAPSPTPSPQANAQQLKVQQVKKEVKVSVRLVSDEKGKWVNYALPGYRLYLSAGLVKSLENENEIAAAIAIELAHLACRHAIQRLETNEAQEFQGQNGIFSYSMAEMHKTLETAVEILYRAGYDSRGLVSLWGRYEGSLNRSPFDKSEITEFRGKSYQSIAMHAPLRNPIVRTQEFLMIKKRIKSL